MTDAVTISRDDGIAVVSMNRPARRNSLSEELYPALLDALLELQDDLATRAVVLTGGEHFCAGGDVGELNLPALQMRWAMHVGGRIARTLIAGRIPVVAAVAGNAYGAGFSLAIACDFVVADTTAVFCAAFGRVGLIPDYALLWSLPQRISISKVREIVMFCEPVRAAEAHSAGLIDELVESGKALEAAVARARRLAAAAPATISATKSMLARAPLNLDTLLAWEADIQTLLLGTPEFAEAVRAFRERRQSPPLRQPP